MHAQGTENFEKFKRCSAYETVPELKAKGRIRHFGSSFHDRAGIMKQALTGYPQVEAVQLRLNYVDYDALTGLGAFKPIPRIFGCAV
ncbi:MAG: hypothetical protein HFE83_07345 [Lachnospiraceae bacterium]|nr:hypothetical protein [Lachnospiraceae bacterium]